MIAVDFPAVPISDRVAQMIGATIPLPVLQAEIDADMAAREIRRFRPVLGVLLEDEDQVDRERELSRLAAANKVLAAYNPRLIVTSRGAA